MHPPKKKRIPKSLIVIAGLASCVHSPPPKLPIGQKLKLSETASGPLGKAPLAIVAAGPRGVVDIDRDPGITMVFNRPMHAVGASAVEGLPKVRVESDGGRSVDGQFRWIGTRGLLFKPSGRLPGATRFTVTVPAGSKALDGMALLSDYHYDFATDRPALTNTFPARPLRPTESIFLQFTQPIEPAELQRHLALERDIDGQRSGNPIPVTVRRGAPDWLTHEVDLNDYAIAYAPTTQVSEPSGTWLEVVPTAQLPLASSLRLVVAKGLRSTEGSLGTDKELEVSLQSYGTLLLTNLNCARQNLGRCQAHRDFTAQFSNPVHPAEFRRYLKISGPARPAKRNPGAKHEPEKVSLEQPLKLDPEFGDKFRVTLRAGMTDVFGQKLAKDVTVDLAIEEPYRKPDGKLFQVARKPPAPEAQAEEIPEVSDPPNATNESEKATPRRPILQYGLELGVTGHILEAKPQTNGGVGARLPDLPISSVNVPTYGLYSTTLPELSAVQWLNGTRTSSFATPFTWVSPTAAKNTRAVQGLSLGRVLGGKPTGAALVSLIGLGETQSQDAIVNVTDLGVSAKISRFGSLVWVTQLSTGTPVKDAAVSVYNAAGIIVANARTDDFGVASFTPKELHAIRKNGYVDSGLMLVARANEDFTYQRLEVARTTTAMAAVDYAQKSAWLGLVFTDRSVYRPGESVSVGGFFRKTAERGLLVEPNQDYQYQVIDSQSEVVAVGEGKLDTFGALSEQARLSRTTAYGGAQIVVKFGHNNDEQFTSNFEILAYKPAEFKVAVDAEQRDYVHRQKADFKVSSEYLYGAPVSAANVVQHISRQEVDFVPPNSQGYVTDDGTFLSDLRYSTNRGSAYSQEATLLDQSGVKRTQVALDAPEQSKPESLVFEAEVQDISGQTQAARASVLVHPALYYLGLKQPKKRFLAVGANLPADVVAFSPKGERVAAVPITLELWRRNWMSVLEDRPTDILHHQTHVRDEKQGTCQLLSSNSARKTNDCHLRLDLAGYYVLRASTKDLLGNEIHSSLGVYAVNDTADETAVPLAWQTEDRRSLGLELDQRTYTPGDTARVLIKSPFNEGTALVTVERGGILDRKVVTLRGKMPVIDIPVKDEYYPNAYIAVHLLRGRVAKVPLPGNADVGAPDYRIGYARLLVNPESRRLKVDIAANQREYRPGESVSAKVSLKRADGLPSAGTVTFYVVDEGVLRLTGYKTPDPLPAFAAPRTLGVFPVESRDHLARILAFRNGERMSPLGFEVYDNSNDKGEEVGGGDEMPGRLRSDFRTTVYFKSGQPVLDDGEATFKFKLPDNLTTYRLMAVAAGSQDRFGFGESAILANKVLMARPALPRILRVGDVVDAGVVVSSKGIGPVNAKVTLTTRGATATGSLQRTVSIDNNGQAMLRFPIKIDRAVDVSFECAANAGNTYDRVAVSRKAEQPIRWLTSAVYGTTDKPISVGLEALGVYRTDQGQLSLTLSNSALVGLKPVFDELWDYPYGCTEQLSSRVLPLLIAPKLAESQNVRLAASQSDSIDKMLGELSKRQQSSGALGFWEGDNTASPWLSAYGLLALETGSHAGYFVPRRLRDGIANYLVRYLDAQLSQQTTNENRGSSTGQKFGAARADTADGEDDEPAGAELVPPRYPNFGDHVLSPSEQQTKDLAEACFVADVLARVGQLDESRLRRLSSLRKEMPLSAKIQTLHAMTKLRLPRQDLDNWLSEIASQLTVGPAEARVQSEDPTLTELLESSARSTAILLEAVLELDRSSTLAPKLVQGLLKMRQGSGYRNTQEDAWALMAFEQYRLSEQRKPADFGVNVWLGEDQVGAFNFNAAATKSEAVTVSAAKLISSSASAVTLDVGGSGKLSYALLLALAKDGASDVALDEGLAVEKLVRALAPNMLQDAAKHIPEHSESRAQIGQLILVDLLLESAVARDRLVVDDPLPAGFEPVEFAFDTTSQALSLAEQTTATSNANAVPETGPYGHIQSLAGLHREMKDDRVTYFIPHIQPGIYHFRYLARATSTGSFVMPPTRAACMYDSEVFGQTKASRFEVTQAE